MAFDWALETALKEAFMEAGFSVVNLGVIPTPYIPCYMLANKIRAGAVLTASHNPSNQNGIKFFLDSKKLLSDGENGDYILSAYMVEEALNGFKSSGTCDVCENVDYTDYAADFLTGIVPSDFADIVKNSVIYVDTANGAWSVTAEKYFSKANIKVNLLNHKTEGFNINRNCGVAEIEGHTCFSAGEIESSPEVVQKVYAEGKNASCNVYGIAVDGDGDRGFAMKYDKTSDSVIVYDGDAEAYLVSELLGLKDKKAVFTIESDIMAGLEMQRKFNLEPVMVDVGDKWICNQNANELALGFESSGHFILPCKVEGTNELLLSGNGLLTALLSVAALEKGIVPFERGFSETFYTYYVNKNLFRYGSELWKQDEVTICEGFKSSGFEMQKVTMKDFNVLAFYAKENDKVVGLVFIRNSGTEDKNAVYLKCCKGFEKRLLPVVEKIVSVHKDCMRDVSREEVKCENEILDLIKKNGSVKAEQLSFSTGVAVSAFHALVKEKVICCKSDEYFLL